MENIKLAVLIVAFGLLIQAQTSFAQPKDILRFEEQSDACLRKMDDVCAIKIASKGLKKYPDSSTLLFTRAIGFFSQGKFDAAIADYTRVIKANPKSFEAFNSRGIVYESIYDYDKAVADYTQAINLNPTYKDPLLYRGTLMVFKGQYEIAEADLKKVTELVPQHKFVNVEYFLDLITTLKNAKFNIGNTKEDTLLKYLEYSHRIRKAQNTIHENLKLVDSLMAKIPQNKGKTCNAISNLNPSIEIYENYGIKLAQMIDDKKLDMVIDFKNDAANLVADGSATKKIYDDLVMKFGCK